jgi:hypothetical protein
MCQVVDGLPPSKSPATTSSRPSVLGNYTQSAVFWHGIRLDMQENAKTPQIDEYLTDGKNEPPEYR